MTADIIWIIFAPLINSLNATQMHHVNQLEKILKFPWKCKQFNSCKTKRERARESPVSNFDKQLNKGIASASDKLSLHSLITYRTAMQWVNVGTAATCWVTV